MRQDLPRRRFAPPGSAASPGGGARGLGFSLEHLTDLQKVMGQVVSGWPAAGKHGARSPRP
eukprot:1943486-Pyramimonas_sp.AAC.1